MGFGKIWAGKWDWYLSHPPFHFQDPPFGVGENQRMNHVNTIFKQLGPHKTKELTAFHSFAGKKSCLEVWQSYPDATAADLGTFLTIHSKNLT